MPESDLDKIIESVQKNSRYAGIDTALVASVARTMLKKGFSTKETVKRTRAKLHQVGGAYQEKKIPYQDLLAELSALPTDLHADETKEFCRKAMRFHRSTEERLYLLHTVYDQLFSKLSPINSILDLACGFNPLSLPWMPVTEECTYFACDIYPEMVAFINTFFAHFSIRGEAFTCDLTQKIPQHEVDFAIVFKTIPCLEQVDKTIGLRLLSQLNTKTAVVSFPVRSLSGRAKDMPRFYEEHFLDLIAETNWQLEKYATIDELFFILYR